ncbi:MAG: hypothetical protein AAF809_10125 [Bacteroidota bacterium]
MTIAGVAVVAPTTETATRAGSGDTGLWTLRSEHLVFGMPRQTDNRHNVVVPGGTAPVAGLSVLVREGFVIGHYDLYKVPAWVSVRWDREDHDAMSPHSYARPFAPDEELPTYAQADTSHGIDTVWVISGGLHGHGR